MNITLINPEKQYKASELPRGTFYMVQSGRDKGNTFVHGGFDGRNKKNESYEVSQDTWDKNHNKLHISDKLTVLPANCKVTILPKLLMLAIFIAPRDLFVEEKDGHEYQVLSVRKIQIFNSFRVELTTVNSNHGITPQYQAFAAYEMLGINNREIQMSTSVNNFDFKESFFLDRLIEKLQQMGIVK